MQALINAATLPSTAVSVVFTNCTAETTQKRFSNSTYKANRCHSTLGIQELSTFNLDCVIWIIFHSLKLWQRLSSFFIHNAEKILKKILWFRLGLNLCHASSYQSGNIAKHCSIHSLQNEVPRQPKTRGPWATVHSSIYLQMPRNSLPVLPQQLGHKFDHTIKRSKVILVSSF